MKRLFFMLMTLFILYLGIQCAFFYFSKEDLNEYKISKDNILFNIKEKSNFDFNVYSYVITFNNNEFYFDVNADYNKLVKVLKDIKYYNDNEYSCILPIFKDDKLLIDMICLSNNEYNYYSNIKGKNKKLDSFASNLKEYHQEQFNDKSKSYNIEGLNVFRDNLIDDHYLGLNNYKGIYVLSKNINSTLYNISLFNNDVYNQKLGIYYKNYYVVADYNKKNSFIDFNIVDMITLETFKITSDFDISFDSKMIVLDNKLYLHDNDSSKSYEIDIKNKKVLLTSIEKIANIKDENVLKFDNIGNTYTYKKVNNKYKIYKENKENLGKIYLFTTTSLENLNFIDNYIYFINDNYVNIYNDKFGIKKIIECKELQFNKNLKLYLYKK